VQGRKPRQTTTAERMILGDKVMVSARLKEIDTATETRTGIDNGCGIRLHLATVVVAEGVAAVFATRSTNRGRRNLSGSSSSSSRLHRVAPAAVLAKEWATARERGCGPMHGRTAVGVSVSKGRRP